MLVKSSSPVLVMRSGVGSAGGHVVLQRGFWGQLLFTCICAVLTVLSDFAPCPPSLVSMRYPLFCSVTVPDGCRSQDCHGCPTTRLLCTGLSWLPYVLGSCARGSTIFPGTFPKLIYCWLVFKWGKTLLSSLQWHVSRALTGYLNFGWTALSIVA